MIISIITDVKFDNNGEEWIGLIFIVGRSFSI